MNRILAALALSLLAAPAAAHDYTLGALQIAHPHAIASLPGAKAGSAYLAVTNTGLSDDRLIEVRGDIPSIQIHDVVTEDGVTRMIEQEEGLLLPVGETVRLAPGGMHLMLMGLSAPLVEGEALPLTLVFEEAGEIAVEFAIEARGDAMDHTGHGGHGDGS